MSNSPEFDAAHADPFLLIGTPQFSEALIEAGIRSAPRDAQAGLRAKLAERKKAAAPVVRGEASAATWEKYLGKLSESERASIGEALDSVAFQQGTPAILDDEDEYEYGYYGGDAA